MYQGHVINACTIKCTQKRCKYSASAAMSLPLVTSQFGRDCTPIFIRGCWKQGPRINHVFPPFFFADKKWARFWICVLCWRSLSVQATPSICRESHRSTIVSLEKRWRDVRWVPAHIPSPLASLSFCCLQRAGPPIKRSKLSDAQLIRLQIL